MNGHFSDTKLEKFIIYANDAALLFPAMHEKELFAAANKTPQELQLWSKCNSLKINRNKTKP